MGQPDKFVEVEFHIVLAVPRVFGGISLAKGSGHRFVIDAPRNAERCPVIQGHLDHAAAEQRVEVVVEERQLPGP